MPYLSQQVRSLLSQDFLNTIDPPLSGRMPAHSVVVGDSPDGRQAVIQAAIDNTAMVREQQVVTDPTPGVRNARQLMVVRLDYADQAGPVRSVSPEARNSVSGVVFSTMAGTPVPKDVRADEFLRLNDLLSSTFPGAGGGVIILDHISGLDMGMKRVLLDALSAERLRKKGLLNVHVVWSVDPYTDLPHELGNQSAVYWVAGEQEEAALRKQTEVAMQKSRERYAIQLANQAVDQVVADDGVLDEAIARFSDGMASLSDDLVTVAVDALRRTLAERVPKLSMPFPGADEKRQLTTEVKKNIVRLLRDNDPNMPESRRNAMIQGLIHPTARTAA